MKTFIIKPIVPLFITLLLTGCMPDSMTKFKKDPPKKAAAAATDEGSTGPVVDENGEVVPFTAPTYFLMGSESSYAFSATGGAAIDNIPAVVDGSVSTGGANPFLLGCSLVTSGVNAQAAALPSGLTLDTTNCVIKGTPTVSKSVTTAFCSDLTTPDQTTCESTLQVWNSGTATCENTDFKYGTQEKCEVPKKWYTVGSQIPYKIELRYQDSTGAVTKIYATAEIGTYVPVPSLKYTQADKLLAKVTATDATLNAIVPVRTTTSITGSYLSGNMLTSQASVHGVANYVDVDQKTIGIKKLIKMTLSSASAFSVGGFLINSTGTKIGKIFKKDTSNTNTLYVENISGDEIYFAAGDSLDPGTAYVAPASATITSIDETPIFSTSSPKLDNDRQYYTNRLTLSEAPSNSYLVNSTSNIKPLAPTNTIPANNGVVFTVSPKLPLGLTLNATTGKIEGKLLRASPATTYTITAANPLNSSSAEIKIVASEGPKDLSLTTKQIITVSSTLFFVEGESLFQQVQPPMATAPTGKILKILPNGYQMAVETYNGAFLENASLDSGSGFYSEKAYVIPDQSCVNTDYQTQADCESFGSYWSNGPVHYNLALKISANPASPVLTGTCSDPLLTTQSSCEEERVWDTDAGICSDTNYLSQATCEQSRSWGASYVTGATSTAKGIVAGYDDSEMILFVRHITQSATSVAAAKTFQEGETLTELAESITEVDYNFMKLTLTDATLPTPLLDFVVGKDVTSANGGLAQAGGYIYAKSAASKTVSISDITKSQKAGRTLFRVGDNLHPAENVSGAPLVINKVTHDVLLVTERNVEVTLNTSISTGSVIYSITPSLPTGLSLNTVTGVITGKPTTITPKKDFILTATNFIGQVNYVFSLEVRDYFTISDDTEAPSFLLHKVGDTQVNRKCRVNATDILNSVSSLDIRCYLEGEEEDINFNTIKFKASVGPGVCQYVQYAPYYTWKYAPKQSNNISTAYPVALTVYSGCDATPSNIPTTDMCEGNYKANGGSGPNCDEGKLQYFVQARTGASGACVNDGAPVETFTVCGGKKNNCMVGPVKDLMSEAQLEAGYRSLIYQSPDGLNKTWTLTSPTSQNDKSNMRVANNMMGNLCTGSNADFNTWSSKASSTLSTAAPYGQTSPFYSFNCLNAASQIKARIRVVVREWDNSFKINNGIDLLDPTAEGDKMDDDSADAFGYSYNKYYDWDNDYAGTCSLATYTTEASCLANAGVWTSRTVDYVGDGVGGSCGVKEPDAGVEFAFPGSNF